MKIAEAVFEILYLLFAVGVGIWLLSRSHPAVKLTGLIALILGAGDAFHLVPRIFDALGPVADRTVSLGLGKFVTSVTMTLFYILLFDVMRLMPDAPQAGQPPQLLRSVLIAFAAVRIALCLFPQNRWFDGVGNQQWGIYRNLPFVAMGILTVLYLLVWYHARMLAILVTVSFACYMGVVLYAKEKPMMGMLMIPKTICYIWMIVIFLSAL